MFPGKKILLANILYSSNLLNLFRRLPLKNKLIVLNYHRVRPDDPDFSTPFDEGTFTIGASQFAAQVGWLKQNARIFSEKDLINGVHLREKPSKPGILITFDDGYRDNYEIAYPILKDHNVPATFFIPTKLISSRRLGWWDLIAYLIKHSPRPDILFEGETFSFERDRRHAIEFFHRKMKLENYERTRHLIEDLREICEVDFPEQEIQDQQLLTWDHVMKMSEDLISIGSHTHTHRVLATLDPIAQKEEMILSKLILEQKLGRKVDSIAYPVGGPEHVTEESRLIAIECGYRIGFTCNTGVNVWNIEDLLTVKRISGLLEDIRTVSAIVILPEVFMWNKAESIHIKTLNRNPNYVDFSFRLGLIYLAQGRIGEAIERFQNALIKNPHYTEARIKLGISQAHAGKLEEAITHFRVVLERHPNYPDVHHLLGIIYTVQNRVDMAMTCFMRAIELNPFFKDARIKLGILYCRRGQYGAGIKELEEAGSLDPNDEDLMMAVKMAKEIMASSQDPREDMLRILNQSLFGGDNLGDRTIEEFNKHIDISPNLSDMLSIITNYSEESDALQVLVPLFQEYIEQYPGYSDLNNAFGLLYLKLHDLDKAETLFRRSLDLNPNYLKARINLFKILIDRGKFEEALEQGKIISSKNLPYPDIYYGLGEVYFALSQDNKAILNAQRVIELNSKYGKAYLLLARIHERQGKTLEAIKELEKMLRFEARDKLLGQAKEMILRLTQ